MNKQNILVISTLKNGKDNALSAWSNIPHPFHLNVVSTDEAAIELFHHKDYDMVVIDCTDSSIDHKKLNAVLPILQENITLVPYQGETEKELVDNVEAIFKAKKYQRIQRMLMLDSTQDTPFNIPPFSLN